MTSGRKARQPSHPELLDWLACEFTDSGWDVKRLVRKMVMSETYRQTSSVSEAQRRRDPGNRWLARQSRFRLDAELVRDSALRAFGLALRTRSAGPSVKPYQPPGYWVFLNFPKRDWVVGQGAETSIAGACTHTGSGRFCTRACWHSTRRHGKSAWSSGRGRTRRCRRSCC